MANVPQGQQFGGIGVVVPSSSFTGGVSPPPVDTSAASPKVHAPEPVPTNDSNHVYDICVGNGGGYGYGTAEAMIDISRCGTGEVLAAWAMPSTATIGVQEMPRPLEKISLLAARGERESAQIAIRPRVMWGGVLGGCVDVGCTDLCSVSGGRLQVGHQVRLRRVMPVYGIPDALVPVPLPNFQLRLSHGETVALWLSVDVPANQEPGVYEGEVVITAVSPETQVSSSPAGTVSGRREQHSFRGGVAEYLAKVEQCTAEGAAPGAQAEVLRGLHDELRTLLNSPYLTEADGPVPHGPGTSDDPQTVLPNRSGGQASAGGCQGSFGANHASASIRQASANARIPVSPSGVRVPISLTVWRFCLPVTPSLPAVFGVSDMVIEDRYNVKRGSERWREVLDLHFKWLLQYRISPYFCRWGDNMRVLTYTCPWPADHPKADEYYSDPRLAAYAVPYMPLSSGAAWDKQQMFHELRVLKDKPHFKKSYHYLWDEPLSTSAYDHIHTLGTDIRSIAPDARILTSYFAGPRDGKLMLGTLESLLDVPRLLRPHTQIHCVSEWAFNGHEEIVGQIQGQLLPEAREECWTYVCMGPPDPHPNWHLGMRGTQHRAVMWRVWKEGGTGFLYWGTNCYDKALSTAAEVRFRPGLPWGDGVLFYPGQAFSADAQEPVASCRLERLLSGTQDFEYLRLHETLHGRQATLALMSNAGLYYNPMNYAHEHGPVDYLRGEIARSCNV